MKTVVICDAVHADPMRQQEDAQAVPGLSDWPLESPAHCRSAHAWRPDLPGERLQALGSPKDESCNVHVCSARSLEKDYCDHGHIMQSLAHSDSAQSRVR